MDIFDVIKDFGVFPSSLVTGLLLGAVFDVSACLRCFVPVHKAVLFICDVLYMLFYWFTVFTLSVGCEGRLRYHIVAGVLFGAVCFHLLIGRPLYSLSSKLAKRLKDFIRRRRSDFGQTQAE